MKKLLITLAALSLTASTASAQSFCTCDGTGNVLKFTNNPITYQNQAPAIAAVHPSGSFRASLATDQGDIDRLRLFCRHTQQSGRA
jgi:hypothetical protein